MHMDSQKTTIVKKEIRLFQSLGWKRNLLAVAAGFVVCTALEQITIATSGIREISGFDLSVAVMPLCGFSLAGWGVLGFILANVCSFCRLLFLHQAGALQNLLLVFGVRLAAMAVYCILPGSLWYRIRLKGEDTIRFPRMNTCAHVLKYYVIILVSTAIYVAMTALAYQSAFTRADLLNWAVTYTQYVDVALILGIPLLVLVSLVRNKTVTINERLVLAFLFTGVIAASLGGFLIYRTAAYLAPQIFREAHTYAVSSATSVTLPDISGSAYLRFRSMYYVVIAILLNGLLAIELLFMRRIEKKVTEPIIHVADALEGYADHEEDALDSESVITKCAPYEQGCGEVSSLTRTCVSMVGEIDAYTENLKAITAEKERIATELNVASKIQKDMLPGIFPPFPDRPEINLYASMLPAKEVGGDFYDFYLLDQEHLVLTIADVSGKGVPASLFMVISKTLLNNYAQSSRSPKRILTYVNHQLCVNNESCMFCTVWLGILNLRTGHMVCANAGHEYPVIRRRGGEFELFTDKHDLPLGLRDGLLYHDYEITLAPGDCLFQYTDGVPEATDCDEKLFGEERLIETLNREPGASPQQQIIHVHEAIEEFVKEAPQFDDTTMLCVEYRGSDSLNSAKYLYQDALAVPARLDCLERVTGFVEKNLDRLECPEKARFDIELAAEETFVNIVDYAYDGGEGDLTIEFGFDEDCRTAVLVFTDSGIPFDPTIQPAPDTSLKAEEREVRGLGIHIVRKTMDEVLYEYAGGKNILTIRKYIGENVQQ